MRWKIRDSACYDDGTRFNSELDVIEDGIRPLAVERDSLTVAETGISASMVESGCLTARAVCASAQEPNQKLKSPQEEDYP